MNKSIVSSVIFFFSGLILVISGCSPLRPATDPLQDKQAFFLATRARAFNQDITASKGTGWARLETQTKTETFKIAWAAVFPDKIRITFLLSGLPVETIISTGETITFLSHTGKHSKQLYHSKDPDMMNYIKVRVKMSEIILVLLGRFPLQPFDDAYFSPLDSSLSTITLKQKERSMAAQYLHFDGTRINGLKSMDNAGKMLYEMTILNYQTHDFGDIPATIEIKDPDNRKLMLELTGFQPNPPVKESVFRLTEPG